MKAKTIFKSLILGIFISSMIGCSKVDEPKPIEETIKITLSADKQSIQANGQDAVKFTVYDGTGNEVNSKCDLYINGQVTTSNTFTTDKPGTYKAYAQLKNSETEVKSNEVSVVALDPHVETIDNLFIKSDKTRLLADNADMMTLSVVDSEGTDVTSSVVFYVNGQKLDGRYLKSDKQAVLKVTATLEGKKLKNELQVSAFSEVSFHHRVLVEFFTGTWCQWCWQLVNYLGEPEVKNDKDIIVVSLHLRDGQLSSEFESATTIPLFDKWDAGTPTILINRTDLFGAEIDIKGKTYLREYIKKDAAVGLAIENSIEGDKLSTTVHVRTKNDMKGKLVIVLTQGGYMHNQYGMGIIEHNDVMRNYFPNVMGKDVTDFVNTATKSFPFEISFKENAVTNIDKCHITAFLLNAENRVVNVQRVHVKENIGY